MVNKNLKQIAEDVGGDEINKAPMPYIDGYEYISKIGFYVSDKLTMIGYSWRKCYDGLHEKGSIMLTPEQWWKYYNYCESVRPDIFNGLETYEFVDVIAYKEIDSTIMEINSLTGKETKTLKGPVTKELLFNLDDLDEKTGLPKQSNEEGKWLVHQPNPSKTSVLRIQPNFKNLYFDKTMHEKGTDTGVRECMRPKNGK